MSLDRHPLMEGMAANQKEISQIVDTLISGPDREKVETLALMFLQHDCKLRNVCLTLHGLIGKHGAVDRDLKSDLLAALSFVTSLRDHPGTADDSLEILRLFPKEPEALAPAAIEPEPAPSSRQVH